MSDNDDIKPNAPTRLLSLDVFRGLIMCTLAVNGFAIAATAKKLGYGPDVQTESLSGWIWQTAAFHNAHPPWNSQFYWIGCSYWDLIQPAFMFMVGVAMPYSYARRKRKGHTNRQLWWHAFLRAGVLVLLGVFLQTKTNGFQTNALFTNVLAQIGLGYFFVYIVMTWPAKIQIAIASVVLVGYSLWMSTYPLPNELPEKSLESIQSLSCFPSIAKQYAFGVNAAAQTDLTFLRWLLDNESLEPHRGGYATLNFVPSLVTMLLGVWAAMILRSPIEDRLKLKRLAWMGAFCMLIAVTCGLTVCPVIKRIWTPAWTLYSGAYVVWTLAALYWFIDVAGFRRWTLPLVVVGVNSLAMYLMSMLIKRWVADRIEVYFGDQVFAGDYGPMIQAASVFAVLWLVCLYLYRNKLFFRI